MMSTADYCVLAAAQVVLPWSIPCWLIGSGLYLAKGQERNSGGWGRHYYVTFAPISMPILAGIKLGILT